MSTVDTTPQDPRVHIDWGGEHVTMQISTGNVQINLSVSREKGDDMILALQWATSEIERFAEHCALGLPEYGFRRIPHPEEVR